MDIYCSPKANSTSKSLYLSTIINPPKYRPEQIKLPNLKPNSNISVSILNKTP